MNTERLLASLSDVERLLADSAQVARLQDRDSIVPAYALLQNLKEEHLTSGLTRLGALLRNAFASEEEFESLRWIAFHFDLPLAFQDTDPLSTRNWVAMRVGEQALVDVVHNDSVGQGPDHISDIYAPSIVATYARQRNPTLARILRRQPWLYRLNPVVTRPSHYAVCPNRAVCPNFLTENEFICFSRMGECVLLDSCLRGTLTTLGELLREEEQTAARRFERFAEIIRIAQAEDYAHIEGEPHATLRCDFYGRLPVFFACGEERYLTEVFIAIHTKDNDVSTAAGILATLTPILRLCVSLVNSQVGYNIAGYVRSRKMADLLHAVVRHDLDNFCFFVEGNIHHALTSPNPPTGELREMLLDTLTQTHLMRMASGLDVLWRSPRDAQETLTPVGTLTESLQKCCPPDIDLIFEGDLWQSDTVQVPRICRIVLANLFRNATSPTNNRRVCLRLCTRNGAIEFVCLSEAPIPDTSLERRCFDEPLSELPPAKHKGIWICRSVVERLLAGRLWRSVPEGEFGAVIHFLAPSGRLS